MILLLNILITQLMAYFIFDKNKITHGRSITFLLILCIYLFLLPYIFYPNIKVERGYVCGLPIVAMFMAFWGFGCGLTLLTHLIYGFIRRRLIQ
jgi:hypothetical protein